MMVLAITKWLSPAYWIQTILEVVGGAIIGLFTHLLDWVAAAFRFGTFIEFVLNCGLWLIALIVQLLDDVAGVDLEGIQEFIDDPDLAGNILKVAGYFIDIVVPVELVWACFSILLFLWVLALICRLVLFVVRVFWGSG